MAQNHDIWTEFTIFVVLFVSYTNIPKHIAATSSIHPRF